ncbi:indolethylamine N-methyltransferase-like isoform X1 [Mytilus trossulus]|uniref:indolethylamine N-methyltransferase-like isoform X1 n=1 Tax=Mytilus trossulus TaxID=6551 RepID=UPI003003A92A
MAETIKILSGEDYVNHFDSKAYTGAFFSEIEIDGYSFAKFRLKTLHKIYSKGNIRGKVLLEIGSGPCIHTVIPAASWFDEIILTDFSPSNRDMQEKWLKKDHGAHNWDNFFKYYSKLDGNEDNWQQLEATLRPKIKRVLPCDVYNQNPLDPIQLNQVDVICTSACLESACLDKDAYHNAMKNVISLLKPGGKLILIGVLNCPQYTVGSEIFKCFSISRDEVINTVKANGLDVIELFDDDSSAEEGTTIFNGTVVILAEKK